MADLFCEGGGGLIRVGWPGIVVKRLRCGGAVLRMEASLRVVLLIARYEHGGASMGWVED